jgi:oxygen-independent coproporphyrinogen-3 oxidase
VKQSRQSSVVDGPLSLYLHIPFCRRRCTYCDFNTYAGLEDLFVPYTSALADEVRRADRGERVTTIFFGGGTPSILPVASVADLLAACRDAFAVDADAEISLAANPGTLDAPRLAALRHLGINRLSLGVQSAQPDELALLGRLHTFDQARRAVAMARAAGYETPAQLTGFRIEAVNIVIDTVKVDCAVGIGGR